MQQEYRGQICIINRIGDPACGPTARLLQDLAQNMRASGWQTRILFDHRARPRKPPFWQRPLVVLSLLFQALHIPGTITGRMNAVVTMTDPPGLGLAGRLLGWLWRCPSIHWCQDLYPDILAPRFGGWIRKLHPGHDYVIVPGPDMLPRQATHAFNWPEQDIAPEPMPDLAKGIRWLYSGNLGWVADLSSLFAGWAIEGNGMDWHICGHGSHHDKWQRQHHLPGVYFMPPVPATELSAHLGAHHIHIVALRRGTGGAVMPMKFISAMAAGRPVLLVAETDTTLSKWVRDEGLGWVAPPDDAAAIAAILQEVRKNPEQIIHRAAAAKAWYDRHRAEIGPDHLARRITEWLQS